MLSGGAGWRRGWITKYFIGWAKVHPDFTRKANGLSFLIEADLYQCRIIYNGVTMHPMKRDIATQEDIKLLVDTFYGNIRENELLGPIFNNILDGRWDTHLEKMYRFWQTVLLQEYSYNGAPFPPHANMPIEQKHFETWVRIWYNTIDGHFTGEKANEAKWRGDKMAMLFLSKINYFRDSSTIPLV